MRFGGRIRFEGVDTGDLAVEVEVDDTHVRISSGGESLGSWCLADVVATRILANEFHIDLYGEEVVFTAHDPVTFAYGAVQAMAEGWARFRSMNVLRRAQAVASARRRNQPQRLDEARRSFSIAAVEHQDLGLVSRGVVDLVAAEAVARSIGAPDAEPTRLPGPMVRFNAFPGPEPSQADGLADGPLSGSTPPPVRSTPIPAGTSTPENGGAGSYADGRHPSETSGLRANMRSVFGRSNGTHEHTMVESTTAAGLTRRVCAECGYVSIGVAD